MESLCDDRGQRVGLYGFLDGSANDVEVFRVNEFAQRMTDQFAGFHAENAGRHRGSIRNRSVGGVLGDEVSGVVGDQLVLLHRFDQRIFPRVQAGGEAIERASQRMNFAAAAVAGQCGDPLLGSRVTRQVLRGL